jgi:hypothetical protein
VENMQKSILFVLCTAFIFFSACTTSSNSRISPRIGVGGTLDGGVGKLGLAFPF